MYELIIDQRLSQRDIEALPEGRFQVSLSAEAIRRTSACRDYLDQRMARENEPLYGINTGFGALYNVAISRDKLEHLQKNLVMSHATGTGETVPPEIVRIMMVLKIQSLVQGFSGVQVATVERLTAMLNHEVIPVVYQQGSLGASGDLAPLAHLSLPLLGLGEVWYKGEKKESAAVLKILGWDPLVLKSKEGLALLNGTQFMGAYALWCLHKGKQLLKQADIIAALSLDAYDGRIEPFHPLIHQVRPHRGQQEVAASILQWLEGSEIASQHKQHVQDPYSFRCIPQVHGASRDAFRYAEEVIHTEINAVTDNPTVFPDDNLVISAGNFHGQPLALVLDFMAIALAETGSISERRAFKLLSGQRGLPVFLTPDAGLNSGLMITQYTAASIVSQNKQLCSPASIDTIDSSNGQEDHVSMGANAATKLYRVVNNVQTLLAIELLHAAQALESRRPLRTSAFLEKMLAAYRKEVPYLNEDTVLYPLIQQSRTFLESSLRGSDQATL